MIQTGQAVVEVLRSSGTPQSRAAQIVLDVLHQSSTVRSRTAQASLTILRKSGPAKVRCAQAALEILRVHTFTQAPIVTMQAVVEIVRRCTQPTVHAASIALEVLRRYFALPEPILEDEYVVEKCAADAHHVVLTLGLAETFREPFPRWRFSRKRCRWVSPADCPYAQTCGKTLADCITRGRTEIFGGFPGIPGASFDA